MGCSDTARGGWGWVCTDSVSDFFLRFCRSSVAIRAVAAAIVSALRHLVAVVAVPADEAPAPVDKAPTAGRVPSGRAAFYLTVPLANVLPLRSACPLGQHRIPEARVELQEE